MEIRRGIYSYLLSYDRDKGLVFEGCNVWDWLGDQYSFGNRPVPNDSVLRLSPEQCPLLPSALEAGTGILGTDRGREHCVEQGRHCTGGRRLIERKTIWKHDACKRPQSQAFCLWLDVT